MRSFYRHVTRWGLWEVGRGWRAFLRRFGILGVVVPVCASVAVASWFVVAAQTRIQSSAFAAGVASTAKPALKTSSTVEGGRARLRAFEDQLLAHDDIPDVVQEILGLAEQQRLVIARGEYKPEIDLPGGFMRYRMTLPVKGEPQAINRFIQAVLRAEPMLVLESVQFKRDRPDALQVEARLQWSLLTHLPPHALPVQLTSLNLIGEAR